MWFSVRSWPALLALSSCSVKSVGSGVGILAVRTSSLLWAFEKLGYGRLVRDSKKEAVPDRLAVSTAGIEALRGAVCVWEEEVEEGAGGSGSGSLVDTREERWDGRFRPFFVVTMEDLEDLDFLG